MKWPIALYALILAASVAGLSCAQKQAQDKSQAASGARTSDGRQDPATQQSRYIANENSVVYDKETDLEWFAGPDERTTWDKARSWVESLSVNGGGWRMPTKEELRGLYSKGLGTRNMTPLLKTTGWWVWSSAETEVTSAGWGFSFSRDEDLVMTSCAFCDSRGFAVRARR